MQYNYPMLTHCVFFWGKSDLSSDDKGAFKAGLRSLLAISSVVDGSVGEPAPIVRAVVDHSYSFALMLRFRDQAGHDAYQVDPIHDEFHARCVKYWEKVLVYDFTEADADVGA